jgi:hypothetical protein
MTRPLTGALASAGHRARWQDLRDEFDAWGETGRCATLWWRDDDAVAPTPALERLLDIAGENPLALAVIPARASSSLTAALATHHNVVVLQHGWSHRDHAEAGCKKNEFPEGRALDEMVAELAAGRRRLAELFGAGALPVLVPPWNRISATLLPRLPALGFTGVSTHLARAGPMAWPGLGQVNVHADLLEWPTRRFLGEAAAIALLIGHLADRRNARVDADEPTGVLTHHLVHGADAEAFLARLIDCVATHPAARWVGAAEAFARR